MTDPRTPRIPTPLYAAAGIGDLALEQLRKLPAVVTELTEKAATSTAELREKAVAINTTELREKATVGAAELRERAAEALRTANTTATSLRGRTVGAELDVSRLRTAAIRNAAVVVSGAHSASERAVAAYGAMVARGERVVASVGTPAEAPAPAPAVPAQAAGADAPKAPAEVTVTPEALATKETVAKAVATKATRTPARTTTKATAAKAPATKAAATKTGVARSAKRTPASDEK
ncbi:hypothetical protein BDK92_3140 [Micromonospora pisi]|uniref:Heparin binding hemagglutinin HbhA n=1 Tax=Micromonospora pisi TaxID=589240 RepID=A0A495JL94_9ACTN|nr:hypothetical protein [Micromonospora pisi]RKR88809.1 hypothetical protein BDK92_3140 [Micromonospora pisi]